MRKIASFPCLSLKLNLFSALLCRHLNHHIYVYAMHVVVVVSSYFYCSRCWHFRWPRSHMMRVHEIRYASCPPTHSFFMISTFTNAPHINYEWHRNVRVRRRRRKCLWLIHRHKKNTEKFNWMMSNWRNFIVFSIIKWMFTYSVMINSLFKLLCQFWKMCCVIDVTKLSNSTKSHYKRV